MATEASPRRVRTGGVASLSPSADWQAGEGFSVSGVDGSTFAGLIEILKAQGLEALEGVVLLRHRTGESGLPALCSEAEFGFAIDLTDTRQAIDGGLLLFVEPSGRVTGWRAEAGALTLWNGDDPVLTELAPGAPERITLFGRARRL